MRKFTLLLMLILTLTVSAQQNVNVSLSGINATMDNGLISLVTGKYGRITSLKYNGVNVLASNGIYFDYTAAKNTSPNFTKAEIVKSNNDYAEVLLTDDTSAMHIQQGIIMRKGVSGVYVYIIVNGSTSSAAVSLREARVCTRLASGFTDGYVDQRMQGRIPTNAEMKTAEQAVNTVQDATYRMADGSVYTKYNWAQYIDRDSVHGLMNGSIGVWNIHCSKEYINGGPMKQELTVHATSKSPITIQMLQGEHMGASAQTYADGERKIYGPFFIYLNKGTRQHMIDDAKAMAHAQEAEWPFMWFDNALYPLDRATVKGKLNITNMPKSDSIQMVLAEPSIDPYLQGKKYIYWALTDADGNFTIKNVRKGNYTLYGYATKGEITDEFKQDNITVDDTDIQVGTLNWTPTKYAEKLWQIGENNRMSDGYKYSDTLRNYGLFNLPPATLTYTVNESKPENDWYYAQTKNGVWTVKFKVSKKYQGMAYLTASVAGATNKPKITVGVNGSTKTLWSLGTNDAAIYRSSVLGGRHWLLTCAFPASALRLGDNTVSFTMSGISGNGGVMWDCIKLEAGEKVLTGITTIAENDVPCAVYTLDGKLISKGIQFEHLNLYKGIYIYKKDNKTYKIIK